MQAEIPRLQAAPPASMADQLLMLRRHVTLIVSTCLAFTLLAAIFAVMTPPAYTASAVLLYNPAQPANAPPASSQDEDAELASQAAIITSLPALKQIAGSLGPGAFPSRFWPFARPISLQDRINATRRALAVFIPSNARLLEISFTGADPAAAAAAANLAVSLYLNHQRDQSFADLQAQQSWLQAQQTALQTDLDSTQSRLAAARGLAGQVAGMQGDLSAETASGCRPPAPAMPPPPAPRWRPICCRSARSRRIWRLRSKPSPVNMALTILTLSPPAPRLPPSMLKSATKPAGRSPRRGPRWRRIRPLSIPYPAA